MVRVEGGRGRERLPAPPRPKGIFWGAWWVVVGVVVVVVGMVKGGGGVEDVVWLLCGKLALEGRLERYSRMKASLMRVWVWWLDVVCDVCVVELIEY